MNIKKQLFVSLSLSLFCVSCGASKISQCQQIFIAVNNANQEVKFLTSEVNGQDLVKFNQAAEALKVSAQNIEGLKLKDPQLIEYQKDFINIYNGYGEATSKMITAKEKNNRQSANEALQQVSETTKLEKETGEKLQNYCLNNE
jgi:hypothetical protein